jgi:hypothetical protein
MAPCSKGRVRFIPSAWDVPQNAGGTAWGTNSRYVVCAVYVDSKTVELKMVLGRAPDAWADLVWDRAATAPFMQGRKRRPRQWVRPFQVNSGIEVEGLADADGEEIGGQIFQWLRDEMTKPRFKDAVAVMSDLLVKLGKK